MQRDRYFQHHVFQGKDIYVVDDHHKALAAWALIRRQLPFAPNLITLDHHTDAHEAFWRHSHWEAHEGRVPDQEAFRLELVARIDWRDDVSIADAIEHLKHDEHIDAATRSGTLSNAFCIQLSDPNRRSNASTTGGIHVLAFDCFMGCTATSHNDACSLQQANEIIEARYLDDQLARGAEISSCLGLAHLEAAPYILDIDLDVFHTRQAISPRAPSTFYRLISNAAAVTIATEAECVADEWLDDADHMSADELLEALLTHIQRALNP